MNPFFSRAWSSVLLAGLATLLLVKGVVPAVSEIDADFPGYYTAARIVLDRQNAAQLYDDAWFREQIRRYGLESSRNPGKFAPFPPPTALLLVPLASLEPLTALRVLTAISVLCLILSIFLLARMLSWHLLDAALFILSSGLNILSCLRFGQPYILVSTSCILGYYLYVQGKPWVAGMCLGLFVPIKYYPVFILAYFAFRREWKVALGGAVAILAIALVSISVLGWPVHQTFLVSVLGNHLTGHLSLEAAQKTPFAAAYQSFDTLFNRLFIFDPDHNPQPLWAAPLLRTLSLVITKGALVLVAVATLFKIARQPTADRAAASIGILGILVLLIAPATATYTFVLFWLPVALLIGHFLSQHDRMPAYFALCIYVLIGFIGFIGPYTSPFEGRGGLSVLAYPRLFLLLALFVGCSYFLLVPGHQASEISSAAFAANERKRSP
jgi:hypothetical protein